MAIAASGQSSDAPEAACPLPVCNEETETDFLPGMLDEYLGRRFYEGGSDEVERFYPGHDRSAGVFRDCLEILAGAIFRYGYGDGHVLRYANSGERVPLVAELLREIGCENVMSPTAIHCRTRT